MKTNYIKKLILVSIAVCLFSCSGSKVSTKVKQLETRVNIIEKDSDNDGVSDLFDKDKNTDEGSKTYGDGTTIDSDGDGIADSKDGEPFSILGEKVDATGVAVDTDGDGVPDSRDLEPNTMQGGMVNFQGISISQPDAKGAIATKGNVDMEMVKKLVEQQIKNRNLVFSDDKIYAKVEKTILDSLQKYQTSSMNIDAEASKLLNGTFYLKADSIMKMLKPFQVDVGIINQDIASVILSQGLSSQIPDGATLDQIKVDSVMSAELKDASGSNTDPAFEITPNTADSLKLIDGDTFTKWHWVVTPKKSGKQKLQLVIKIRKSYKGISFVDEIVIDKEISVQTNTSGTIAAFFDEHWQWMAIYLFIPFITWYFKRREKLLEARIDKMDGKGV